MLCPGVGNEIGLERPALFGTPLERDGHLRRDVMGRIAERLQQRADKSTLDLGLIVKGQLSCQNMPTGVVAVGGCFTRHEETQ